MRLALLEEEAAVADHQPVPKVALPLERRRRVLDHDGLDLVAVEVALDLVALLQLWPGFALGCDDESVFEPFWPAWEV